MDTQLDIFTASQKIPNSAPGLRKEPEYFNTTGLTGHVLKERQFRAGSQNDIIYKFFQDHPGVLFTPWEISNKLNIPIRSAARAITTLQIMGKLVKTDVKKVECQGEENFCWTYNNQTII